MAALALGAEGIVMGTRFLATEECPIHSRFKEWILQAQEADTMVIQRSILNTNRVMKNEAATRVLEMENRGATLEELMTIISGQVGKKAEETGDLDSATIACGQVIGLIRDIPTVKELIDRMMREVESVLGRLNGFLQA
jgi:nitronate monooxygenase